MAIQAKLVKQKKVRPATAKELARLRAEVARLQAELRALKGRAKPESLKDQAKIRRRKDGSSASALALPRPDADGNYPAEETLAIILAQQIVRRRQAAGWTQAELAKRAGVRQETVSRIETGKNAPNVATVDKIDRVLKAAGE